MTDPTTPKNQHQESESLPFAELCKKLEVDAPIRWIKLGWRDLRQAPMQSLSYGAIRVLCSYVVAYFAITFGNLVVLLALLSGFIFLGPMLAMACYDISLQLQRGRTLTLVHSIRESWRHIGNELVFAVTLIVIFLVWALAASLTQVFFPALARPTLAGLATFLTIGTIIGSIFSAFVFCVSAFSLLIVATVAAGIVTAFIGLGITLPLTGHATWHACLPPRHRITFIPRIHGAQRRICRCVLSAAATFGRLTFTGRKLIVLWQRAWLYIPRSTRRTENILKRSNLRISIERAGWNDYCFSALC